MNCQIDRERTCSSHHCAEEFKSARNHDILSTEQAHPHARTDRKHDSFVNGHTHWVVEDWKNVQSRWVLWQEVLLPQMATTSIPVSSSSITTARRYRDSKWLGVASDILALGTFAESREHGYRCLSQPSEKACSSVSRLARHRRKEMRTPTRRCQPSPDLHLIENVQSHIKRELDQHQEASKDQDRLQEPVGAN